MKFNDIAAGDWSALKPYLDTCLLPVTGLRGDEQPWETTAALEKLRVALELVEIPYHGRVVTYPALHYMSGEAAETARIVCAKLKEAGFRYVLVMTADESAGSWELDSADLVLTVNPDELPEKTQEWKRNVSERIQLLWRS